MLAAQILWLNYAAKTGKKKSRAESVRKISYVLFYRISAVQEEAKRLGSLLEQYGTYEMNGVAFQDQGMRSAGGHHWIARRVPDDVYVVMQISLVLISLILKMHYLNRKNICVLLI